MTRDDVLMLRSIEGSYAYQPPAGQLGRARKLAEYGLAEKRAGFDSLTLTGDGGQALIQAYDDFVISP